MQRETPVFASTCSASNERCWRSRSASDIFTLLIPLLVLGGVCTRAQRQSHPDEIGLSLPRDADMKLDESGAGTLFVYISQPMEMLSALAAYKVHILASSRVIQENLSGETHECPTFRKI